MFWKVAGFSQPSPIEHILDKVSPALSAVDREKILEELLDEDDIIQECKSMNGRLIAFLRERSTIEQLLKYMVEPTESDDPKRTYKYPFTSCEVFCCEIEAVYNTLTDDPALMKLLFSLLSQPPPLSSKLAGYFGRMVANLLLRKSNELTQFLQDSPELLDQLVAHVETPSICDIIKHLVGADEQSNVLLSPTYMSWLTNSSLIEMLLGHLSGQSNQDAQANAAEVLSSIAHTQPSPLAMKLTRSESISALFGNSKTSSQHLLVPTLEVCIALIEPRNCRITGSSEEEQMESEVDNQEAVQAAAVSAIVGHLPALADVLREGIPGDASLETTCGLMLPRMGRHRLKVVELVSVLVRSGGTPALAAVMETGVIELCLQLFVAHPFNNMLHHYVDAMLLDVLTQESEVLLGHLFEKCKFLQWLVGLPAEIQPGANPSQLDAPTPKAPIRTGYMGHATHIGSVLETLSEQGKFDEKGGPMAVIHSVESVHATRISEYTEKFEGWQNYLDTILRPRLDLENTSNWVCGRPANDMPGMDSDVDDFQDMTLEQMQEAMGMGVQQTSYSMYNHDDNAEEGRPMYEPYNGTSTDSLDEMTEAMGGMYLGGAASAGVSPPDDWEDQAAEEGEEGAEKGSVEARDGSPLP